MKLEVIAFRDEQSEALIKKKRLFWEIGHYLESIDEPQGRFLISTLLARANSFDRGNKTEIIGVTTG